MKNIVIDILRELNIDCTFIEEENDFDYLVEYRVLECNPNGEYIDSYYLEMEIDENIEDTYLRFESGFEGTLKEYIIDCTFGEYEEFLNKIGVVL